MAAAVQHHVLVAHAQHAKGEEGVFLHVSAEDFYPFFGLDPSIFPGSVVIPDEFETLSNLGPSRAAWPCS